MIERIHFLYPANNQIHLNAMGGAEMDGFDTKTFSRHRRAKRWNLIANPYYYISHSCIWEGFTYRLRDSNRNVILTVFRVS